MTSHTENIQNSISHTRTVSLDFTLNSLVLNNCSRRPRIIGLMQQSCDERGGKATKAVTLWNQSIFGRPIWGRAALNCINALLNVKLKRGENSGTTFKIQ